MALGLGLITLLVMLLVIKVVVYLPLWVLRSLYLPQWLLLGVALALFAWIFGDDQDDRPI